MRHFKLVRVERCCDVTKGFLIHIIVYTLKYHQCSLSDTSLFIVHRQILSYLSSHIEYTLFQGLKVGDFSVQLNIEADGTLSHWQLNIEVDGTLSHWQLNIEADGTLSQWQLNIEADGILSHWQLNIEADGTLSHWLLSTLLWVLVFTVFQVWSVNPTLLMVNWTSFKPFFASNSQDSI